MTKVLKIISIISFVMLATIMSVVGVWALSTLDFAVGGDITYKAPEPSIKFVEDEYGFYVNMGSYQGENIVWRLVGVDGSQFTGTKLPITGTCTFLLETYACSAITSAFGENDQDYANSTLRSFINGNYTNQLSISADDKTYSLITPDASGDKLWCLTQSQFYEYVLKSGTPPENLSWGYTRYWSCENGTSSSFHAKTFADGSSLPVMQGQSKTTTTVSVRTAFNLVL